MRKLLDQYDRVFGSKPAWVSGTKGLRIAQYRPKSCAVLLDTDSQVFITAGMSSSPMSVPDADTPARVELLVAVPGNWEQVYGSSIDRFFLVDTMLTMARYPFEHGTHLANLHTVPAGRALDTATAMCGWLLTDPFLFDRPVEVEAAGKSVALLLLTPLYEMELSYAGAKGSAALLDRLFAMAESLGLDWAFFMRPQRPDTVGGTTLFA